MSNYFELLRRVEADGSSPSLPRRERGATQGKRTSSFEPPSLLGQLPQLPKPLLLAAKLRSLQLLNERMAPMAGVGHSVRMLVTGCRPGDGASTIAMALALDMSQRLGRGVVLVDGNLRRPDLHRLFPPMLNGMQPMVLGDQFVVRATGLPRLQLATPLLRRGVAEAGGAVERWRGLLDDYPLTIVDLGVVRLDSRLLGLARPSDPVTIVVRYQHTEREELATTAIALNAASRSVAGVIMNATPESSLFPATWFASLSRRPK